MGMDTSTELALRRTDYLWLTLVCAVVFGISVIDGRVLTTHEATHCQNVREMFANGEYLIPTYGGRPWLERPPVPHWLTGMIAVLVADPAQSWAMRFGSGVFGTLTVLVWGWAIAGALGRNLGLLSAIVLATTREFAAYATGPEADIFIASFVTLAGALFIRAEFAPTGAKPEKPTFFGNRPWTIWGFFIVLGATNAMKGPLFGTAFLATSLSVYFLFGRDWMGLRRYLWFWGWLVYLLVGIAWPVFAYLHYPDVADVWAHDYGKRWNTKYIGEPWWYYLAQVPWNLFPWTFPVLIGLAVTYRTALKERHRAWLVVWCWAFVPPAVFSLFNGKHHHYMLSCIAPQAVLGAAGAIALWRFGERLPTWFRSPLFGFVVAGVPLAILALVFGKKIPGPEWVPMTIAVGWLICSTAVWYLLGQRNGRLALVGFIIVAMVVHVAAYMHRTRYLDSYVEDVTFLSETKSEVGNGTIYVLNESHPLNASWLLYYIGPQAQLLHNDTFLASNEIKAPEIYVLARQWDKELLQLYGTPTTVLVSEKTRGEKTPYARYTLYKLKFHPTLARYPAPTVNGMEATGRKQGPELSLPSEMLEKRNVLIDKKNQLEYGGKP
jgi:4-amino-4-deoxy-L-arabinose transferase-like glycosyltransferase